MSDLLSAPVDPFVPRHLGSSREEIAGMLAELGYDSLEALSDAVIPRSIRLERELELPGAGGGDAGERAQLQRLRTMARDNRVLRSYLGMGYYATAMPGVIRRNVLESPGWYTQYTPYQAEISQGRLEALLNFQTMVSELTALPLANASLLDEATAAAEAMAMCNAVGRRADNLFLAAADCHPQTLAVLATRAEALEIELEIVDAEALSFDGSRQPCGLLLQQPGTDGRLRDDAELIARARERGVLVVVATDLLALTLLRPPGELGADVAVGSSQRFGVPLGFGGPHAAFLAASERFERTMPGRIVGVSKDAAGRPAYRLARQTREQHIRREKATSNICTSQVLPAVLASMYAVYHGPGGLARIARRVRAATALLAAGLTRLGLEPGDSPFFDTLKVELPAGARERVLAAALTRDINLRSWDDGAVGVSFDETVSGSDVEDVLAAFAAGIDASPPALEDLATEPPELPAALARQSPFLEQEVFARYHSEHEMLRYLARLQQRDLSLVHSMIPLGSCTMKLNSTAEMTPITWPELADLHPFAPADQSAGYARLFAELEAWLGEITGLEAVSLQPNAGSQGELSGLLVIRAYHRDRGEPQRNVCLIPTSAHGTNPASAVMAGMKVVPVQCDDAGDVDLADLERRAAEHSERLAALMITYPSTHGVFEDAVRQICETVHQHGGQVYLDGANMNAQVGLCRPGDFGADVCHLNLHKTFCIPHGGGGPGMGPICAAPHLTPFLPSHPLRQVGGDKAIGPVAAAPWGSPGILPISWMYIALMGATGLADASRLAILNANYMARRLGDHYPVLYTGRDKLVAHEFILDMRGLRQSAGITVDDIAKRLMDYGFHAPTMSWPVAGTMMVEPTESESRAEIDRFCDAMISIRAEIAEIESGEADAEDNLLKNAPHTAEAIAADDWRHAYSRRRAAFPKPWIAERKFWPACERIDNTYGDRHLVCTCDPVEVWAADD